jgi:SAM-dependent methyltransferase
MVLAMIDRKTHWQNIYQDKGSTDVSWYQQEPSLSLELIGDTGIHLADAIIDVGGGASLLVDHLLDLGYTSLAVLDISAVALNHAKARLANRSADIEWFEADITGFQAPHPFSLWHDRAVFHFLTEPQDRVEYVNVLSQSLIPGGHVIIAAFAIGGPEKCSGLDIVQYDAGKLSAELGESFRLVDQRKEVHLTPKNKAQLFQYFRFIHTS